MRIRKFTKIVSSTLLLAAILACGGDIEEEPTAPPQSPAPEESPAPSGFTSGGFRCLNADLGSCEEISSLGMAAGESTVRANCSLMDGNFGPGGCPTENAIGYCDMWRGIGSRMHYYSGVELSMSAADAQDLCTRTMNGTWTPASP
jgi:hypothetical protein